MEGTLVGFVEIILTVGKRLEVEIEGKIDEVVVVIVEGGGVFKAGNVGWIVFANIGEEVLDGEDEVVMDGA
jgi:hypothetical protein